MKNLDKTETAYIDDIIAGVPFLSFNYDAGTFEINEPDLTWDQIKVLGKALKKLRKNRPQSPPCKSVRLEELELGYYDRCLEHYCYERLNLNVPHDQTCWVRFAEKSYCLGRVDPGIDFNDNEKEKFLKDLCHQNDNFVSMSIYRAYKKNAELRHALKIDSNGWIIFCADVPIRSLNKTTRIKDDIKALIKKLLRYQQDDRVLDIVKNIDNKGWNNELAWEPNHGFMLGYSGSSHRYLALTGRHRIAAARYLFSQGKISGSTLIEVPIITYPWKSWLQAVPHSDSPLCRWCEV